LESEEIMGGLPRVASKWTADEIASENDSRHV
jgi:hypothetical protein